MMVHFVKMQQHLLKLSHFKPKKCFLFEIYFLHFFKFMTFDFKGELRDVQVSYDKNLATIRILYLLVFSECAALSCTFSGLSLRTENVKLV